MEKTVLVVDDSGKVYEATYPRRAKGLVKKGRARFIDDNTICLACPPDHDYMEDIKMTDNTLQNKVTEAAIPAAQEVEEIRVPEDAVSDKEMRRDMIGFMLEQMEKIRQDNLEMRKEALDRIEKLTGNEGELAVKSAAIHQVSSDFSAVNEQLLEQYGRMIDQLASPEILALQTLKEMAEREDPNIGEVSGNIDNILDTIRFLNHSTNE